MGGMAAAAALADAGYRVAVAEKLDGIGGSAVLSAGIFWTAPDVATLRRRVPQGNPDLARTIVEGFGDAVEYIRSLGVEVAPESSGHMGFGTGHQIDIHGLFARLRARVESAGGAVVLRTAVSELVLDTDGAVTGAVVDGPDERSTISAPAVVLATGGFQGDRELLATFVGDGADDMLVRSNLGSTGDGLRVARQAGVSLSNGLSAFYGHLLPAPLEDFGERHYLPLTQYHSNRCLLVNWLGRRFMDESRGDEIAVQELLRQPGARGVLLPDEQMRRDHVVTAPYPHGEVVDRFAASVEAGGRLLCADTLDELMEGLADWGLPAGTLHATLSDYDRASRGEQAAVDAPLADPPTPLREPPFYALQVQPVITFTHGGLASDGDVRVLDRNGHHVAGLYAAGVDVGGVHNVGYVGGLACSFILGRRAARSVQADRARRGAKTWVS